MKKKSLKTVIPTIFAIFILTRFINLFNFITDFNIFKEFPIIMLFTSIFIFALGVFFMSKADLFIPPYDKFIMEVSTLINKKAAHSRLLCDVIILIFAIVISIIFDARITVTIATILITFGVGSVVNHINKVYCRFSSDSYCKLV